MKPKLLNSFLYAFLSILMLSNSARALPVLSSNSRGAEDVTIFPDHQNANLYYLTPTVMLTASDETGLPQFSYVEYDAGWFDTRAIVQTTMRAHFDADRVKAAQARIRAINPQASFAALPFADASVT